MFKPHPTLNKRQKKIFLGNSWFGFVKTAEAVSLSGNHCIMVIKTAFRRSPKKYLESTMLDYPGGTWLVLEGKTHKNVDLLCIGYKYNCKKTLTFVSTRGAGSTLAGKPYQAKYNDIFGNVRIQYVCRLKIFLTYFDNSYCADAYNQCRQGLLGLER